MLYQAPPFYKAVCLLLVVALLNACTSTKLDLSNKFIPGIQNSFSGTNPPRSVKVLVVHGIGCHRPGYSNALQNRIAEKLRFVEADYDAAEQADSSKDKRVVIQIGIDRVAVSTGRHNQPYISAPEKDCKNTDYALTEDDLPTIIVQHYNDSEHRRLSFYELTWSPIVEKSKTRYLSAEETSSIEHRRAWVNRYIKKHLVNRKLADAVVYLGQQGDEIRSLVIEGLCRMWTKLPHEGSSKHQNRCELNELVTVSMKDNRYAIIGESLGSRIAFDALGSEKVSDVVSTMLERTDSIYMLANQLPLIALADADFDGINPLDKIGQSVIGSEFEAWLKQVDSNTISLDLETHIQAALTALHEDEESYIDEVRKQLYEEETEKAELAAQSNYVQWNTKVSSLKTTIAKDEELESTIRDSLSELNKRISNLERDKKNISRDLITINSNTKKRADRLKKLNDELNQISGQLDSINKDTRQDIFDSANELYASLIQLQQKRQHIASISIQPTNNGYPENLEKRNRLQNIDIKRAQTIKQAGDVFSRGIQYFSGLAKMMVPNSLPEQEQHLQSIEKDFENTDVNTKLCIRQQKRRDEVQCSVETIEKDLKDLANLLSQARDHVDNAENLISRAKQLDEEENDLKLLQQEKNKEIGKESKNATMVDQRRDRLKDKRVVIATKIAESQRSQDTAHTRLAGVRKQIEINKKTLMQAELSLARADEALDEARLDHARKRPTGLEAFEVLLLKSSAKVRDKQKEELLSRISQGGYSEATLALLQQVAERMSKAANQKLAIVAFSDPNDVLSYPLTDSFAEHFAEFRFLNVEVPITFEIARLIADPAEAHAGYSSNDAVVSIIACGFDPNHTQELDISDTCALDH